MAKRKAVPELAHIHEALRPLAVDITKLNPDPQNAREHDRESIEGIKASLAQFGQDQLLVVQKKGMIVRKGNGRLLAARELGWQMIAAIVVEESDVSAIARAVADNRSAELSKWSPEMLGRALESIRNGAGVPLESVGFDSKEVERLILFARDVNQPRQPPAGGEDSTPADQPATVVTSSEMVAIVFPMMQGHRDALMTKLRSTQKEKELATASEALLTLLGIIN
jgi:ParB-like chromosome segregation protein Spo0J